MEEWLQGIERSSGSIPLSSAMLAMIAAALLSFSLGVVYLKVHSNKSYARSLVITQVNLAVIIASVLMVIGNSVAVAFGAFGVLGLARFRTDFPDPRDTAAVISSIAIGMACGLLELRLAVMGTLIFIAIQGFEWLWRNEDDDIFWQDLAFRGRTAKKKKKDSLAEDTEATAQSNPAKDAA